jgi:4-amino-4-deoxy-L-arabinose transferase-like glycosyltransferase
LSRSRRPWSLVTVGVVLWLIAVIPAYYVIHKPVNGVQAAALIGTIINLSLLVLTLALAAIWGSRIGRWLGVAFEPGLEQWTLSTVLGLGLLGTVVLGLAAIGGLYRWVGYLLLLTLGLAALPWQSPERSAGGEMRRLWRWLASGLRQFRSGSFSWLCLYSSVIGLLALGLALLPPTAWDALAYHLQGPRLYVEAHRLLAVPENFYLNWPAQVEMLFTWGLLLKGDVLAQLFHWAFWVLSAGLVYALTRRAVDECGARWATALWASVPLASSLAGWPYVDLGLTAFVLAAVYSFVQWTESERLSWLTLSALFAGLAIATKYTAAVWLATLVLLFIYHAWRRHRRSVGWIAAHGAMYLGIASLFGLPWLLKTWIVTGNPIYPFLFGGVQWNPIRNASLTLGGHGYSSNLSDYVTLPWLLTVLGIRGTGAFDATIGPLMLCLAPLALLIKGRPRTVNYVLVLIGLQWVYFLIAIYRYAFMAQTRLLLSAFPLLALAAAFAIRHLAVWDRPKLHLSWVVSTVAGLVLAVNLVTEAYAFLEVRPLEVLAGLESQEGYLSRRLGAYYEAMRYTDESLPVDARLLFLWEPRGYYSRRPSEADPTLDNLAQLRLAWGSPDAAVASLRARGISYLLFYRAGLEFLRGPTPRAPTLGSLFGTPPTELSYYPITDQDVQFLEALLTRCQLQESIGDGYEIWRLP